MTVRVMVELEDAVARALDVVASAHERTVAELLAAAGRHVARTQGGLRQPRVRYRAADATLPEPKPRPEIPLVQQVARGQIRLSEATRSKQAQAVRYYVEEQLGLSEVGRRVGLSEPTVRKLVLDAGHTIRPRGWLPRPTRDRVAS